MIVVSLLLIVVSGGLLAGGVSSGTDGLVITSIGLSLLAAGSLFLGIRQQRDALERAVAGNRGGGLGLLPPPPAVGAVVVARPVSAAEDESTLPSGIRLGAPDPDATEVLAAARIPGVPEQTRRSGAKTAVAVADDDLDEDVDEDPEDEPPAEPVLASEVARLSQLDTEVVVVDGRPRYHLTICAHLAGRPTQPLPVSEAIELGFTGCGECSAATTLLGR